MEALSCKLSVRRLARWDLGGKEGTSYIEPRNGNLPSSLSSTAKPPSSSGPSTNSRRESTSRRSARWEESRSSGPGRRNLTRGMDGSISMYSLLATFGHRTCTGSVSEEFEASRRVLFCLLFPCVFGPGLVVARLRIFLIHRLRFFILSSCLVQATEVGSRGKERKRVRTIERRLVSLFFFGTIPFSVTLHMIISQCSSHGVSAEPTPSREDIPARFLILPLSSRTLSCFLPPLLFITPAGLEPKPPQSSTTPSLPPCPLPESSSKKRELVMKEDRNRPKANEPRRNKKKTGKGKVVENANRVQSK